MKLFMRLAWRNIWRHRLRTLGIITTIGLTMALMFFMDGYLNGMVNNSREGIILAKGSHIQIHAADYISLDETPLLPVPNAQEVIAAAESLPQVVSTSQRIQTSGLISNREGTVPVGIIGVEPENELPYSSVAQGVSSGRFLNADDPDLLYMGKALAEEMGVTVGDRISLAGQSTTSKFAPRSMTIVGIFEAGNASEKEAVYITLAEAQDLYGLTGQSTEVTVTLAELSQHETAIKTFSKKLPGYIITDWKSQGGIADTVESKSVLIDIVGVAMLAIAGIGIFNLLQMAVFERTREIGILGAVGLKPRQITLLFLLEGSLIGLTGLAAGIVLGLGINSLFSTVGLGLGQFSAMMEEMAMASDRVYFTLGLEKLPMRVIMVLVISIAASFIPARQAAHHEPAQSLHYV